MTAHVKACIFIAVAVTLHQVYMGIENLILDKNVAKKIKGPVPQSLYATRASQASVVDMLQSTLSHTLLHSNDIDVVFQNQVVKDLREELLVYGESGVRLGEIDTEILLDQMKDVTSQWDEIRSIISNNLQLPPKTIATKITSGTDSLPASP